MSDDKKIVGKFVEHLRCNCGFSDLEINCFPDSLNSSSKDVDAIADPLAIEHTSIDFLPNQRQNDVRFLKFIDGLFPIKDCRINSRLTIHIPYEFDKYIEPKNLSAIQKAFEDFVVQNSRDWNDGGPHKFEDVQGVPFNFQVFKDSDLPSGVRFQRILPPNVDFSDRLFKQLESKRGKLVEYRKFGLTTVLLVESKDIALVDVNGQKVLNAIREAYPSGMPLGLDQMWYVDTVGDLPGGIFFREFTSFLIQKKS